MEMKITGKKTIEEIIKNASNGTTAAYIKSLDLSTKEGVAELGRTLLPWATIYEDPDYSAFWDDKGKGIYSFPVILDDCGVAILAPADPPYTAHTSLSTVNRLLDDYRDADFVASTSENWSKENWSFWCMICGDNFVKMGGIENIKPTYASGPNTNKFLMALRMIIEVTAQTFNRSAQGNLLLYNKGLFQYGKISKGEFLQRLEEMHMPAALSRAQRIFQTFYEVFMKYVSNVIQDSNYKVPENTLITNEQIETGLEYVIEMNEEMVRGWNEWGNAFRDFGEHNDYANDPRVIDLKQRTLKITDLLIEKFDQFQRVLDEYNSKMSYAKPVPLK